MFKRIFNPVIRHFSDSTMAEASNVKKALEALRFDNLALRFLPVDKSRLPGSRTVSGACFSLTTPTPVVSPVVVSVSSSALSLLDIDETSYKDKEFAEYFSGNKILNGSEPAAHCYCGHQFGYFSGQLGDGAAMYLGEIINKSNQRWELQLKGSGPTPYSRSSDGRKVLRSSIREFLCSEAMHNLGIPSTRAGSCVTSQSRVVRDMFYDGHPKNEQCTIVSRIAKTFLRCGSFEIFKPTDSETSRAGPSVGRLDILEKMIEYTISNFYPHVNEKWLDKLDRYSEFYREVCLRTARLVAKWQCVGFCHGVLNTDNISIVGLTIDYGPYGFMEKYDPNFVCNGSDDNGRYIFKNQPDICKWNMKKFAEALQEMIPLERTLPILEESFMPEYEHNYITIMRKKLGIVQTDEKDLELVKELLNTMEATNSDFTNTFRSLSKISIPSMQNFNESKETFLQQTLSTCFSLEELKTLHQPKMDSEQFKVILAMARSNPGLLQMMTGGRIGMLKNEMDNYEKLASIKNLSQDELQANNAEKWKSWLQLYEKRLVKEITPETNLEVLNAKRVELMNSQNPRFILRNFIAQKVIEEAEKGDYSEVKRVLKLLEHPFDEEVDLSEFDLERDAMQANSNLEQGSTSAFSSLYTAAKTPTWAIPLRVT